MLGPVDPTAGVEAAADRLGDSVTAFVQGAGADRRLVAAEFDRVPGKFFGYVGTTYRALKVRPLKWAAASEIWGPITYTVFIDGKAVGTTTETQFTPPVRVRDGRHRWQIVATDQRGQTSTTASTVLNVDDTPPSLKVKVMRSGTTVTGCRRGRMTSDRG